MLLQQRLNNIFFDFSVVVCDSQPGFHKATTVIVLVGFGNKDNLVLSSVKIVPNYDLMTVAF